MKKRNFSKCVCVCLPKKTIFAILFKFKQSYKMKKLLLLTFVFGAVISCNDYEDDFNNLNDKLNGISTQLDGIETAVQGIASIQLELLNINSAIAAVSDAIGGLPTVADIANLEALINGVSADIAGLDDALATKLTSLESLINNGFSAVDVYLATIDGNLTDAQQSIADVLAELDDIDVELDNIDGDNLQILTQLASMLTAMGEGFDNLSAENQQILLEIGAIQADLTTTLAQIDALNTLLVALQSTVDTNDASVDAQLAAITVLIEALQDDLTVLLESTTTVYNDDLTITNDAQLEYALSLDNKVMVINGFVNVDTSFAGTDTAKFAEIDSVMYKMNTVTGSVDIISTAPDTDLLLVDKLRSVGGDYSVSGQDVIDTSLANVAGNATYNYTTNSYEESNLKNVGKGVTITDNGSASVNFENLTTVGTVFAVKNSGGIITNTLTDATTVKLGAGITDANLDATPATTGLSLNYTASVAESILINVLTTMTVAGAQPVTGDIDITCENLTAAFADVTATDVSVKSDGLILTVGAVVAEDVIIVDNGANADSSITYTSVEADMFDFSSADAGILTLTSDQDAASSWTVDETDIMIEGTVTWTHVIQEVVGASCAVALPITGNVDINSTDSSVVFDFGWMMGDLSVAAETAATVTSYQSSIGDSDYSGNGLPDLDGSGDTNWFAVTGDVDVSSSTAAVVFSNKICVDAIPTYSTNGQLFGDVTLSAETSVDLNTGILYGATDISAKTDVFIGSSLPNAFLGGSLDVNGFAGTVSFSPDMQIIAPVNATGTGTFDGSNWNLSLATGYQVDGDISISATAGIDLSQANELGDGQNGAYVTTLASDGPINLSAVASTSNDVTITGAGNVDLSALVTAAGTLSVEAADTNLDAFVSSTGDVVLASQLNGNALPVLESFVSLTVSEETVLQLVEYVSGTIELIDATTFHSSSVATSDLTADKLEDYVLFEQVVDLLVTGADLPALLTVDVTTGTTTDLDFNSVNDGIDVISVTGTTVTSITTSGHADVFVVSDNDDLVTLNAGHAKGDNETGSKVHILNNDSLVSYTSNTSSLLELRIEDNASLTTIDLSSYLNAGSADIDFTAADLFGVDYIFTITGNAITGNFAARTATNTPTVLESNELVAEAKAIAEHLLSFRSSSPLLASSVTAKADFIVVNDVTTPVILTDHPDAEDTYAGLSDGLTGVDFSDDGINTPDEWNLLTVE